MVWIRKTLALSWAFALTLAAIAASADGSRAEPEDSSVNDFIVASWEGGSAGDVPDWRVLHTFAGRSLGLLPAGSRWLDDPAVTAVGGHREGSVYLLVPHRELEALRAGVWPAGWSAGGAAHAGPPPRDPLVLDADRAVALLQLAPGDWPFKAGPGGRAQRVVPRRPPEAIDRGEPMSTLPGAARDLWSALAGAVRADRMSGDLDYLSTELQTRHSWTPQMELACAYAKAAFEAAGLTAWFDPFTYMSYELKNVVAIKEGAVDPDRIYIVGGHLDSTSPDPQNLAPGADDNGSGAAAVLEIARLLAPVTTDYTLIFICFSAEEQGLHGSEHFASEAELQGMDIRGVFNMDMTGYHDPQGEDLWLEGFYEGTSSVWMMDLLEQVAVDHAGLTIYRYPGEGFGSDHVPFHNHGFPAVLSIENEWDSNPCYHRFCDRVDRLDPWLWRQITVTNAIAAAQLAQVQDLPGGIQGTVSIAGGGDPSNTTLRLVGTGYPVQVTGADGQYAFGEIFPGAYTLVAGTSGCWPDTVMVSVTGGAVVALDLMLDPLVAGSLSGTVRSPGGAPLPGARVEIEGQTASALTGPDGVYVLDPVWPGTLALCASLPDRMPRGRTLFLAQGEAAHGVDFTLADVWDFETSGEGLDPFGEWAWGSDAMAGAHSGSRVWGTVLGEDYDACADDRLDAPPLSLVHFEAATLRCWTWYENEAASDGGHLRASTDGGQSWSLVAPAEGYDGIVDGNCNPIGGQQAFTGTTGAWVERTFALDALCGQWVRLRWQFGSDRNVVRRGWYLDDLSFTGVPSTSGVRGPAVDPAGPTARAAGPRLEISPNPVLSGASIRLHLPAQARGTLALFGPDGRRIVTLLDGAHAAPGAHRLHWDGHDRSGHLVPGGVYWLHWQSARGAARARVLVLR